MAITAADVNLEKPAILGGVPVKTTPFGNHQRYGGEELEQLREALEQNTLFYAHGKKVSTLETQTASHFGSRFAVGCSSGTAAVHAALIAAGISPGDEVITSPITDMGSIIPILMQGAVPVFADVDPGNANLLPEAVEAAITSKTKAILAIHLVGNACDLDALLDICRRRKLVLIEDCAQAWGCTYRGRAVGTWGNIGCYSFNEFKHISCGDGGLVITDDETLAIRLRLATDKGYNRSKDALIRRPIFLGNNYRMSELDAAVGIAQSQKLPAIVDLHRSYGAALASGIARLPGVIPPKVLAHSQCSFWGCLFRISPEILGIDANTFAAALVAEGIPAGAGFIGSCVYEYPIFRDHSAYQRGHHAYMGRDYAKGLCPSAEEFLRTCILLQVKFGYTSDDLADTLRAVGKISRWYAAEAGPDSTQHLA